MLLDAYLPGGITESHESYEKLGLIVPAVCFSRHNYRIVYVILDYNKRTFDHNFNDPDAYSHCVTIQLCVQYLVYVIITVLVAYNTRIC